MPRGNGSGRIYPHQRETNDTVETLGADIEIENYDNDLHETKDLEISNSTRRDYRNRIKRIILYWEANFAEYARVGVRSVSEVDQKDKALYYFDGAFKKDICYTGLNVKMFLKFLMHKKDRVDGKILSFNDIRKYKDAIIWGAKIAKTPLPRTFYEEVETYLNGYKKFAVQKKKEGKVAEEEADPITHTLFKLILNWAIGANNIYVWFWSLVQWNCMARGANVEPLGFHNISLGTDSMRFKYDDSKTKKSGEKLSTKNIYGNPFDYSQCFYFGLGIYCCIHANKLSSTEKLFINHGKKGKSATTRYQEQLVGLLSDKHDIVCQHIRVKHLNAYGMRKGSATLAACGTTAPPPVPSIARRGEWSMGSVLEVYWHFSEPGDQYLGRILVGLDPTDANFGTLPPHFTVVDPQNHPDIKRAAEMMFGPILAAHKDEEYNPAPLLYRSLASVIHHSDKLLEVIATHPGHDFNKIPILHDKALLERLKLLYTLDKTEGVLTEATGIPPHIETAVKLQVSLNFVRFYYIQMNTTNIIIFFII